MRLVEAHKCYHLAIGREGKESGYAKFLFVQPVGYTVEDIGVGICSDGHFGFEVDFVDIEIIIGFGIDDIFAVR